MLFFYIRHGDPIYDPDSLTPLGRRQAEAVAKRLALYGIDRIYASTSDRAIETAKPTCEILKKEMTLVDFANEGHAWHEFAKPYKDGRRWPFHHPDIKPILAKSSVLTLGKIGTHIPSLKNTASRTVLSVYAANRTLFLPSLDMITYRTAIHTK